MYKKGEVRLLALAKMLLWMLAVDTLVMGMR